MLPSTGYFKGIICPFNENGLCERPYCHYRHLDFDESGAILQKLVSAAVLKALQQNDTSGTKSSAQQSQGEVAANQQTTVSKATYNPTPIAELNKINSTDTENLDDPNEQRKRHIPVPYTPRKPTGLPIKRSVDINDPKPFVYNPPAPPILYKPGSAETVPNDTYTPVGTVESKEKYLPGTKKEIPEYTPDTNPENSPNKLNYVPSSDKTANKKKILEYKPAKVVKTDKPSATYQPTPRSLVPCFSSDEDEPQIKKRKLSSDLIGLDDLGPEFDILDQILDEEKPDEQDTNNKQPEKSKNSSKDSKKSNGDISKNENNHKSHHKSKSEKEKPDENYKSKSEKRSSDENRKSKSDKKSSEETHRSKSDKKSSDENHKKKLIDENHKSRSVKKTSDEKSSDISPKSKSEKQSDENKKSKSDKKSLNESHKSKSEKKTSHENHQSKSEKKAEENHTSKSERKHKMDDKVRKKEKKHEHKKSSHKSSSKDRERDSKEKHSSDSKKGSSRNSDHSPKYSKKTEKHSESRSSSSSKSKEKRHKKSKDKDRHRSDNKDFSDPETLDMEENGMEEDYDFSDADEDTIALECKRIFEEYVPTKKPKSPDENIVVENLEEEYIPSKKRVSRTVDKNIKIIPRAPIKPDYKVSAANTMAERLSKVREFHNSRNIQSATSNPVPNEIRDNTKLELQKATFSTPNSVPSKIRIAHVPYASTMLNTKKPSPPSPAPGKLEASSSTTISQTLKKGAQRVAHMPSEKFIDRPGVLEPLASKIPANIRSIYLNMMIDECLKLYLSTHDAYARAQHEELTTSKKCSTVPIYKNSAVLAVSRLRKELVECNGVKKSANDCSTLKPGTSLKTTNSGSWSIESKNKKKHEDTKEFTGTRFYENIKKWVLTEEQLKENSFPRPHESGQNGRAIIYGQNKQSPPKGYIRTCCRCKKEYTVNKKGFAVVKEECIYHPNRKYRVRGEARYQCCTQDGTSDGCCVAPSHVYEYVNFEHLKGYVTTMPPDPQLEDYGVYSLDCEMCYTTSGLELTRVTVINSACKVVYETLVKPLHPIIDYNTRYSGITEEQMCHVRTTLLDVQATLLTMFSSKTILVGHSLESDFKALKLIHDTVIDTSVLFPHKMGPPYKRALRNLSTDYLRKIIQNSVEGHDSAEDAMVCMELLHYKLKEDLKTR